MLKHLKRTKYQLNKNNIYRKTKSILLIINLIFFCLRSNKTCRTQKCNYIKIRKSQQE